MITSPVLLLSSGEVSAPSVLSAVLEAALALTVAHTTLYVQLLEHYSDLALLVDQLVTVYDTARHYNDVERDVDVYVLYGDNYLNLFDYCHWSTVLYLSEDTLKQFNCGSLPTQKIDLPTLRDVFVPVEHKMEHTFSAGQYSTVAVGGTFDHLHDGHKILLAASAFVSKDRLIVGVTGPELLKNKKYVEYLESYDKRVSSVLRAVKLSKWAQKVEVGQINDVCGPTGEVEDIDALVVSEETRAGADFVNDVRKKKGMHPLQVVTIRVVENESQKEKLSSTQLRRREAQKVEEKSGKKDNAEKEDNSEKNEDSEKNKDSEESDEGHDAKRVKYEKVKKSKPEAKPREKTKKSDSV